MQVGDFKAITPVIPMIPVIPVILVIPVIPMLLFTLDLEASHHNGQYEEVGPDLPLL
jgi:hypothetical protein